MIHAEVLIIGGGPAGSACAARLRKNGMDCLILDQQPFPRLKPCAGWVTPAVFKMLEVEPSEYPYGLTTFTSFQVSIRGLRFRLPTHQHAVRRVEFDDWLLRRSGTPFQVHTAREIRQTPGGYEVDGKYSGKFLLGAGGSRCPVYQALFAQARPRAGDALIVAMEEEFPYSAADERCHLWFFEDHLPGYAWYVPKVNGVVNVGVGGKAGQLKARGDTLKSHWEHLVERLDRLGLVRGHTYHPIGHSYTLRNGSAGTRAGGALLAGDSLGLATLDMGEGIGPAIQSGLLAAEAILTGGEYSLASIPRYSLPSLLGLRD